ncbi:hypothetical protein ABK040_013794 [Willaertia magna]
MSTKYIIYLLPLVASGFYFYMNIKELTLPVFLFRTVVKAFVARNKLFGVTVMSVNEKKNKKINENIFTIGSFIRPQWKDLDIESQTLNSLVAFSGGKTQTNLDKYGSRKSMEHQILFPPLRSGVNCEKVEKIKELHNSVFIKLKGGNEEKKKAIFYVHGGGGYGGRAEGIQACSMVEILNQHNHNIDTILSVNYRKIGLDETEKKNNTVYAKDFSDQVQDTVEAYQWMLQKYNPKDITIMGDSFGTILLVNLLAKLGKEQKENLPYSTVLISGFYDLSGKTIQNSYDEETTILVSKNVIDIITELYEKESPEWSPINYNESTISSFNKTKLLLVYGKHEEATTENDNFIALLKKANFPPFQVIVDPGQMHGYPMFHPFSPQIKRTMEKIIDFIQN